MSFLLTCPNCGIREVTDFGYGGEVTPRPKSRPTLRELGTYNYFRRNRAGVQREWWFHRSGCRAWFIAERDTVTNEVLFTALPGELPAGAGSADRAGLAAPAGAGSADRAGLAAAAGAGSADRAGLAAPAGAGSPETTGFPDGPEPLDAA